MTKRKTPPKTKKRVVKKRKTKKSNNSLTIVLVGLIFILIIALFAGVAWWIGYEAGKEKTSKLYESRVVEYKNDLKKLREKLKNELVPSKDDKKESKDISKSLYLSEIKDYLEAIKKDNSDYIKKDKIVKKELKTNRPKLVIIIDDVAYKWQIRAIKSLPWKVTPSIFPPSSRHPDTPKLAATLNHYMIHLPMEAIAYRFEEDDTLKVGDSKERIEYIIKNIRELFPKARFINNHTGSKFTSDISSMKKLFSIIQKYNFTFLDSRTTPKTAVPAVCKSFNKPYIARDIFLDNKTDISYIKNQLKKAVKLAKKHGYSIAIGHPHKKTFKALADSVSIFKNVDIVYMDDLYKTLNFEQF